MRRLSGSSSWIPLLRPRGVREIFRAAAYWTAFTVSVVWMIFMVLLLAGVLK